jgi:hypothetical protein
MDGGNRVRWPSFDRNVYVWGTPPRGDDWVARVLMPEQKVEDTSLESIYFSRSGEYYYRPKPGNQAIFRTADQTEVNTPAMSTISSFELLGWSPAQNVLWMRVALRSQPSPLTRTNVLFDLDNDTITNVGRDVVGWAGEGRLLRQSDDGPEVVSIADAAEQAKAQAK